MATAVIAPWDAPLARSLLYEAVSLALLYPEEGAPAQIRQKTQAAAKAARDLGWTELAGACDELASSLNGLSDDGLVEHYIDIFSHGVSKDCPQYEGEYDETHIFMKTQNLADLATFYSAFGVAVSPGLRDRLDHISVELEFMHLLTFKEAYAGLHGHGEDKVHLCQDAQKSFLQLHLSPWIKSFMRRVRKKAAQGTPYDVAVRLLDTHMKAEFEVFGISPAPSRQVIIPLSEEGVDEMADCPMEGPI